MSNIPLTARPAMPTANLEADNPLIYQFEIAFESDGLKRAKINLGSSPRAWNDLDFFNPAGGASTTLVYRALLTQTSTNAPVATVLENSLGGEVVWTRNAAGDYRGTLTGAFPEIKYFAPSPLSGWDEAVNTGGGGGGYTIVRLSDNVVIVSTLSGDGSLANSPIQILVYP